MGLVYLPTRIISFMVNVGKYSIHGASGDVKKDEIGAILILYHFGSIFVFKNLLVDNHLRYHPIYKQVVGHLLTIYQLPGTSKHVSL